MRLGQRILQPGRAPVAETKKTQFSGHLRARLSLDIKRGPSIPCRETINRIELGSIWTSALILLSGSWLSVLLLEQSRNCSCLGKIPADALLPCCSASLARSSPVISDRQSVGTSPANQPVLSRRSSAQSCCCCYIDSFSGAGLRRICLRLRSGHSARFGRHVAGGFFHIVIEVVRQHAPRSPNTRALPILWQIVIRPCLRRQKSG